jgi:hypothetical protein
VPAGNLVALHELDIYDKHSQIVPIFKATRVKFDRAIKGANRIRMRGIQVALGPDEKLNMVSGMTGRIELESDIHATFDAFSRTASPWGESLSSRSFNNSRNLRAASSRRSRMHALEVGSDPGPSAPPARAPRHAWPPARARGHDQHRTRLTTAGAGAPIQLQRVTERNSLLSFHDPRACALFRCDPRVSLQRSQADRRVRP